MPLLIHLQGFPAQDSCYHYHLANCFVQINHSLPALEAFRIPSVPIFPSTPFLPPNPIDSPTYQGRHWLANQERLIRCYHTEQGTHLFIDGVGGFFVAVDGQTIIQKQPIQALSLPIIEEVILGPALLLALAIQDLFCLHASAVLTKGRLLVFVGESGQGKSTLAAYLGELPAFQLAVDDVMPWRATLSQAVAYPWFPQLKREPQGQMVGRIPHCVPIHGIYYLMQAEDVGWQDLKGREKILCLIRHTIATRLFAGNLLAQHMQGVSCLAQAVPVKLLSYPRQWEALPAVAELLEQDIGG